MTQGRGLLEGIRVLDFTQALSGPYATMTLGDLGADVVKVESMNGDDARRWGPPFMGGESAYFLSINRNKRSVTLDLKSEKGREAAVALAARSEVVIENFRPGTAARLGIGAAVLRENAPGLIYCSISGFGQDLPPRPGYDQIVQGTAGLMSITGTKDGPPIKLGIPIADIVAGMFAVQSILAALFARERTGDGRVIDIAMQDAVISLLTFQAGRYFATGSAPGREGNHHPTIAPYGAFETLDGYVNICVGNDLQWRRLCEVLGSTALHQDDLFGSNTDRLANRTELHAHLQAVLRDKSTREWLELLDERGVPAGPIRTLDEVFGDDQVRARDMRIEMDHPTAGRCSVTGFPWKFDEDPPEARRPPPLLGEHTVEVLRDVLDYPGDRPGTHLSGR